MTKEVVVLPEAVLHKQMNMVGAIKQSRDCEEICAFIQAAREEGFLNSYITNAAITQHLALTNIFQSVVFFESLLEKELIDISYSILIADCRAKGQLELAVTLYFRAFDADKINISILTMMLHIAVLKNDYLLFGHLAAASIGLFRAGRVAPDRAFSAQLNVAQCFFSHVTNAVLQQQAKRALQASSHYPNAFFAVVSEEAEKPKACIGYEFNPGIVNAPEQAGVFIPL